ncbi:MAG: hypothetical protein ACYC5Q_14220 [Thermoleophilia bacterium]
MPSGNAMAATVLLKLGAFTGEARYALPAERTLAGLEPLLPRHPLAFGQWLMAFDTAVGEVGEAAVIGGGTACRAPITDPDELATEVRLR